jgi:hypothetical protein
MNFNGLHICGMFLLPVEKGLGCKAALAHGEYLQLQGVAGARLSRARLRRSTSRCSVAQRRLSQRSASAWCSTTASGPLARR